MLSLTGSGSRGSFTAQVVVELCDRARRPGRLDGTFDVFGGASIGGLMACALAVGVPPRRVLDATDANGSTFGEAYASEVTLRNVCLATSAAPTYFRPHVINGAAMLDGVQRP